MEKMKRTKTGDRVRVISSPSEKLWPGMEGTVQFVDSPGTIHVKWDNGMVLGLVPDFDVWEIVPREEKQ